MKDAMNFVFASRWCLAACVALLPFACGDSSGTEIAGAAGSGGAGGSTAGASGSGSSGRGGSSTGGAGGEMGGRGGNGGGGGGASGGSGGSAGLDGGPGPDVGAGGGSAEDARRDSPAATDGSRDARADGATGCTALAPPACSQCCIDQNWGDAGGDNDGFNLLFGDLCDTCRSTCTSKRPCGIRGEPSADGPCMACLQPKIQMRCDRGAPADCSTPFLRCFLACPTQ
jgi:hypothetical protein